MQNWLKSAGLMIHLKDQHLKTSFSIWNPEFIKNGINNDDYQKYIEFIDDQIVQETPQMIIESENVWFIYYLISKKCSSHFL